MTTVDAFAMFQADAIDLFNARAKSMIIHRAKNIRSAGDELEIVARGIFARRFSPASHVTHGHIIDSNMNISKQLDIIIAKTSFQPVFHQLNDGSQHILYDAVHAIGEVKSSIKISDLQDHILKIKDVKFRLLRDKATYLDMVPPGLSSDFVIRTTSSIPFLNPLFCFMLVVNSDNLDVSSILEVFHNEDAAYLPNVLCFLDKGVVVMFKMDAGGKIERGENCHVPEFVKFTQNDIEKEGGGRFDYKWAFLRSRNAELAAGFNLMQLYVLLRDFLGKYILKRMNMAVPMLERLSRECGMNALFIKQQH